MNRSDYLKARNKKRKVHVAARSVPVLPRRPADAPLPPPKPDIRDIWKIHEAAQHLPRFPQLEKYLKNLKPRQALVLASQVLVVIAAVIVLFSWLHPSHPKVVQIINAPTAKNTKAATTTVTPTQPLTVDQTPTAEKPNFTVYYPGNLPAPLTVDKSTIKYNPDSFSFRIGTTKDIVNFFVTEQSASEKFNLSSLKSSLGTPVEYSLFIGTAVTGNYKTGSATGILTKDNTLIIINCSGTNCTGQSKILANDLQINTDNSIYKKQ